MLSDIEIAQNAKMLKIKDIAKELGIDEEELIPYGHYKAKISQECIDRLESKEDGKLILVTAINPTPAGEGKTTTSVGLAVLKENRFWSWKDAESLKMLLDFLPQ